MRCTSSTGYVLGLSFLSLVACSDPDAPSVGRVTARLPPFDKLDSVRLGMSVRELTRLRHPSPAPYIGLAEQIGDTRIEYQFGHSTPDEGPPHGRLWSVTARTVFSDEAAAEGRAATRMTILVRSLGLPASCRRRTIDSNESVRARWVRMNQILEIVLVAYGGEAIGEAKNGYAVLELVSDDTTFYSTTERTSRDVVPANCVAAFASVRESRADRPSEDAALFALTLRTIVDSFGKPAFVDPKPPEGDSSISVIEMRSRVLRQFGVTPAPLVLHGRCTGVLMPDPYRHIDGCPPTPIRTAEIALPRQRDGFQVVSGRTKDYEPHGSSSESFDCVFQKAGNEWRLTRIENRVFAE